MTKKAHRDGEQKPVAGALRALEAWLDASGLRRVALVEPLEASQMQISRVFAGTGYLSATQRRALEEFTGGAISAAMLDGSAKVPAKVLPKRPAAAAPPLEVPVAPTNAPGGGRPQSPEEAERALDELATRAMPAAFKLIVQQMVQAKSEAERRRCAEILIEHLRGKAKQYEKREQMEPPATDEELLAVLTRIEKNLGGRSGCSGEGTGPGADVAGGAPGDGDRAEGPP